MNQRIVAVPNDRPCVVCGAGPGSFAVVQVCDEDGRPMARTWWLCAAHAPDPVWQQFIAGRKDA